MRMMLTDDLIIFKHSVNDEIWSLLYDFQNFAKTVFYNKNLMENKLYIFKEYYSKSMERRHQAEGGRTSVWEIILIYLST